MFIDIQEYDLRTFAPPHLHPLLPHAQQKKRSELVVRVRIVLR